MEEEKKGVPFFSFQLKSVIFSPRLQKRNAITQGAAAG
jgi:hypothetical protein